MDKQHILVVDDNHINRLFFESSLKKLNLDVSLAESGFQAVELCRQQSFDLILMDIRMDGMDGVETAAIIKTMDHFKRTPILAISAERFDFEQHLQFANSMLKPISQVKLKKIISDYLPHFKLKPTKVIIFDESKALQISHHDAEIVAKLRQLLIQQLPEDWQQLKKLYDNQKTTELDAYLHKVLGSAKVCAAQLLIASIERFKTNISKVHCGELLKQVKIAIDGTIEAGKKY